MCLDIHISLLLESELTYPCSYLHDSFEVETHAVPQGKLPATGTSKQSSAFGCPFHDVDRVLDLVERRVEVFGRYCVDGVVDAAYRWYHLYESASVS